MIPETISTVAHVAKWFIEEDQSLSQTNAILAHCIELGIYSNKTLLTVEAISIFMNLIQLLSLNFSGGSILGKSPNVDRNRGAAFIRLMEDYFCVNPT